MNITLRLQIKSISDPASQIVIHCNMISDRYFVLQALPIFIIRLGISRRYINAM